MAEQLLCPGCGKEPFVSQCGDPPRRLIECKNCSFAADESDWQTRTPGPATKAMLVWAKQYLRFYTTSSAPWPPETNQRVNAFVAEWPKPAKPPAPEQPEQSPWHCAICGKPMRIGDDLQPWHIHGPANHEAELSDEDCKTLADGLRLTD